MNLHLEQLQHQYQLPQTSPTAIRVEGLDEALRRPRGPRRYRLRGTDRQRARRCSAPTAPARPRPCGSSPPSSPPTAARRRSSGSTSPARPTRCGPGSASPASTPRSTSNLTGRENLRLIGRLTHLGRTPGRPPGRRAARTLRPRRRRRPHRPAPTRAGCAGGSTSRPRSCTAAGAVPRRADHRPRPARPQQPVGGHRGARRRRHDGPAHDAVPRGGRPPRRRHHPHQRRSDHRRGHADRAEGPAREHRRSRSVSATTTRRARAAEVVAPFGVRSPARPAARSQLEVADGARSRSSRSLRALDDTASRPSSSTSASRASTTCSCRSPATAAIVTTIRARRDPDRTEPARPRGAA